MSELVWLNIVTVVFSLISCGFSLATIVSMRRAQARADEEVEL